MKTLTITTLLILFSHLGFSQHIFPEEFNGCNTDLFSLESDSTDATIESKYLINTILSSFSDKDKKR